MRCTRPIAPVRILPGLRTDPGCARMALVPSRVTLLCVMGLVAGNALSQEHHHESTSAAAPAASLYTQDDLMFLTHMVVHHRQALDMAALVPSRSHREEFVRFARYVDGAQRAEIDQMNTLLREAADRGMPAPHHDMTGDPPMHGMLSKAQMAALAAASGPEFERLWLEGMIYHHQGALDMARAQQEAQFKNRHQPYGIDVLVDDMLNSQRAEIAKMQGWLTQWGLEAPPTSP
jgi:uncharacterized protein (DUF305 family)